MAFPSEKLSFRLNSWPMKVQNFQVDSWPRFRVPRGCKFAEKTDVEQDTVLPSQFQQN